MKKITQFLLLAIALVFSTTAIAQSTVTGTVTDSETNSPLPGVNVIEKGTTNGVSADFDGNFTLKTGSTDAVIVISYVGFLSQEISISGDTDLGNIQLAPDSFGLDEIHIIASVAVDRKTPVAVSTVKADDIQLRLGTQEFPEILKSTPGVFATRAGGGFGDGRINVRGFASVNVAVLINGIPINDMENGRVFWSNWAGLGGVTSQIQVQRGLGASKLAVPSIGGTINIITRTTDVEAGGNVFADVGNDNRRKYGLMYSTGLMENGFAVTVAADKTDGDGYVDGTQYTSVSYFMNISKQINDQHKLAFSIFGAKQRHGQRQNRSLISTYRNNERGIKYNPDWGYKNGQVTSVEDNFYNKPQMSLNHYWTISEKTKLVSSAYASYGSGGGGGTLGSDLEAAGFEGDGRFKFSSSDYRIGNFGTLDFDRIVRENIANGANGSSAALRASRNDHSWYGLLSTLRTDLSDSFVLTAGLDWRAYKGFHYRKVTDLLGGQFILNDSDVNNPINLAQVGDKVDYDNNGIVGWFGLFSQLEYEKNNFNAFVSLSGSNTSYKREDFFNYLDSDPTQITDSYNFLGYSVKGGANYRIGDVHNVFANIGYFEKAPIFDAVFLNFRNDNINENAENEKITSFELGYGLRSEKFAANVNLYYTQWSDRSFSRSFQQPDGTFATANILGVNAVHQGLEIDFVYKPSDKVTFSGMASFGDWRWENNLTDIQIFDEAQNPIGSPINLYIKDLRVGDAAQTTMALGTNIEIMPKTNLVVDYNYFANLYARYDPSGRTVENGPQAWELPDYGTVDIILRHGFKIGDFDTTLTARLYNMFDTNYIGDALDGGASDASTALVWFANGRTFNLGVKVNF
ncbi:TonB-dependent receptor [Flavobacteriaceae bacterium AH-315-B10]|nr:TonB-dependent receptor [Flavobacteriaceae bacterium AH-315-B10]